MTRLVTRRLTARNLLDAFAVGIVIPVGGAFLGLGIVWAGFALADLVTP